MTPPCATPYRDRVPALGPGSLVAVLIVLAVAACHDGRWMPAGDGVVRNRTTGLEWTSRSPDESLTWEAAERHCRELSLGGHADWRLPEIAEVRALYDKHVSVQCGDRVCHLDSAIRLAGPYVWSATAPDDPTARFYFDFAFGNQLSPKIGPQLVRLVLCVRRT